MTGQPCAELVGSLPIRARGAFVLGVAERMAPPPETNASVADVVHSAMRDAWRWVEGNEVSGKALYDAHIESLGIAGSQPLKGAERAALDAATSAYYYVTWHAFRLHEGSERLVDDVPNDMAEMTENVIDEVCRFASQSRSWNREWVVSFAKSLSTSFGNAGREALGSPVPRTSLELEAR